jgi:hypothetical protein
MRRLLILCLAVPALAGAGEATGTAVLNPEQTAQARKLYLTKCAKCHKLYDPSKYSDPQWEVWMDKMSRKAKLRPEQQEALARYVGQTARQSEAGARGKSAAK